MSLVCERLTVDYGTLRACDDVSFDVHPGEALGIVGESGSGKSTLLRCLNLDRTPTAGRVLLDGEEISDATGARRRRLRAERLGIVHQRPELGLQLEVSAGGNIGERLLAVGERSFERTRSRAGAVHEAMELAPERLDDPARAFSGGMRQRVQLARALVSRPRALFLDEPTSGLDVSVQARILDLIRRIHRTSDACLVLVSHDLAVVRMLCERVLVMRAGRVIEAGLTDQILSDPQHPYSQLLVSSQLV